MHYYRIVVPLLHLLSYGFCEDHIYCHLHPFHTLCLKPEVGRSCHQFREVSPSSVQREKILKWHNRIRQKLALGMELRNDLPTAANMMKMEWDNELAEIAQRHANQCVYEHDCRKCRGVFMGRFAVGQNIGFVTQSFQGNFEFTDVLRGFYEKEAGLIPEHVVNSFYSNTWGHYSQLIWWNTRAVGCGGSSYLSPRYPNKYEFFVVCNYGAAGNLPTTRIYSEGPKCSECPEGTICDSEYDGLCAINEAGPVDAAFRTDQIYFGLSPGHYIDI